MFNWFKKKDDKRLDEIESSVKTSFQNMKSDMSHVSKWITHFKEKHDDHHTNIEDLNKRLKIIESLINHGLKIDSQTTKVRVPEEEDALSEAEEENEIETKAPTRDLTTLFSNTQRGVFNALCGLVLESQSKWVSIKTLTDEAYSDDGGYDKNRSLVSQFITLYEINGLIERKRVGKETYITVLRTLEGKDFSYYINLKKKASLKSKVVKKT